ncbi:MAG: VanZ family protein [Clostridium perfringens]|nr:VanZ family protein [Clostridium perfringens]
MWRKIINVLFFVSFIFYISFLLWNILFKYVSPIELFSSQREFYRSLNLIPFNDIIEGNYNQLDVIGNFILFIPLGIYASMFLKKLKWYENTVIIALISLTFEVSQYIFAIGASDITDIITNTVGGSIGIGIYLIIKKIFREDMKVKSFVSICSTLVMIPVAFIIVMLFIYN